MGHVVQIKLETPPEAWHDSADESPLRFQCADGSFFLTDEELLDAQRSGCRVQVVRRIQERELPVRFSLPHDGAVTDWPPEDARLAVLARLLAEDRATGAVEVRFLGRNRIVPADGFALDRAGGQRRYVWQVVPTEIHAARPAVQERFRALRAVCADPNARVVLSLGSGGLKLFAHATALRLFDALGIGEHFSEVWGSSAGAMAGLLYAQGLSAHAIEQMGYDLYTGRVDLALRPSKLLFLRHLVRDALLPSFGAAGAGFVDVRGRPLAHARALLRRRRAAPALLLHRLQPARLPARRADSRDRAAAPGGVHGAGRGAQRSARVVERAAPVRAAHHPPHQRGRALHRRLDHRGRPAALDRPQVGPRPRSTAARRASGW